MPTYIVTIVLQLQNQSQQQTKPHHNNKNCGYNRALHQRNKCISRAIDPNFGLTTLSPVRSQRHRANTHRQPPAPVNRPLGHHFGATSLLQAKTLDLQPVGEELLDPPLSPGNVEPPLIDPIPPVDDPPSDQEEIMADAPVAPASFFPFMLTPAEAISDVLNYAKREHMQLYESAVAPLEGDKFDGTAENLANFQTRLHEKAEIYMWY